MLENRRKEKVDLRNSWYKENESDKVWWLDNGQDETGLFIFSFDAKTPFNLYEDYPHKLTKEQKEIFDKENPFWADYFKGR